MLERNVGIDIDKTYADLKAVLVEKGCRIISEEPPKQILVKQGSLWGMSPRSAKKKLKVILMPMNSGTKVTCSSNLDSDWKNITAVGCVLAAVLIGLCLWITLDLNTFMVTEKPSFWSWIITVNGIVDFQIGRAFVNLTEILAVFLSVIIVLEIVIAVYAHARIDRFAEEILNSLSSHDPTWNASRS